MIRPNTFERERFANTRAHQVSDYGHGIGFAVRYEAGDGVTVLLVIERDALDRAAQLVETDQWINHRGKYKFT